MRGVCRTKKNKVCRWQLSEGTFCKRPTRVGCKECRVRCLSFLAVGAVKIPRKKIHPPCFCGNRYFDDLKILYSIPTPQRLAYEAATNAASTDAKSTTGDPAPLAPSPIVVSDAAIHANHFNSSPEKRGSGSKPSTPTSK